MASRTPKNEPNASQDENHQEPIATMPRIYREPPRFRREPAEEYAGSVGGIIGGYKDPKIAGETRTRALGIPDLGV